MTNVNVLDPGASALDYYGFELRRYREAAGLTQRQLGDILNYTGSLVGQIETARKLPTVEFSQRADAALNTGGLLSRLVALVTDKLAPLFRGAGVPELALLALLAGVAEEALFRGVIQSALSGWLPVWAALVATAVTFGPKLLMLVSVALWCAITCGALSAALPAEVWASATSVTG